MSVGYGLSVDDGGGGGHDLRPKGGCQACGKGPGVTIATQTIVSWVNEEMERLQEAVELVESHLEERDIVKEILDEAVSEASSKSRPPSIDIEQACKDIEAQVQSDADIKENGMGAGPPEYVAAQNEDVDTKNENEDIPNENEGGESEKQLAESQRGLHKPTGSEETEQETRETEKGVWPTNGTETEMDTEAVPEDEDAEDLVLALSDSQSDCSLPPGEKEPVEKEEKQKLLGTKSQRSLRGRSREKGSGMYEQLLSLKDSKPDSSEVEISNAEQESPKRESKNGGKGKKSSKQKEQPKEEKVVGVKKDDSNEDLEDKREKEIPVRSEAFYNDPASLCVRVRDGVQKQEMMVGIERNPALKDMAVQLFGSADAVEKEVEEEPEVGIDKDTVWIKGDATLPSGWTVSEPVFFHGHQVKTFRSPTGEVLNSREEVVTWLENQGHKVTTPSGLPVPETDESKCTGHCEGGCQLLALDKKLFRRGDPNMRRRKAKIVYKEAEAKIRNKVQEIRNPKYLPGPGLCYGVAVFKAERSKIINIEEVDNTSAPVVENPPDTVDEIESGEVLEPEMTESPSKKTKIDMKKKSESNKKSESEAGKSTEDKSIISEKHLENKNLGKESKSKNDLIVASTIERRSSSRSTPPRKEKKVAEEPVDRVNNKSEVNSAEEVAEENEANVKESKRSERRSSSRVTAQSKETLEEKRQEPETPNVQNKSPDENISKESKSESVKQNASESQNESTTVGRRSSRTFVKSKDQDEDEKTEPETPKRESKNGGKGKKSSSNKETVNTTENSSTEPLVQDNSSSEAVVRDKSDTVSEKEQTKTPGASMKETKNGGKGKKSKKVQEETATPRIDDREDKSPPMALSKNVSVNMTPTKDDKKQMEEALKNRPRISPQQKSAAILNILSNTKRRARSKTPQPPPMPTTNIASESEESVDLSDCVETVTTEPENKKSRDKEATPSVNGLANGQSQRNLTSELESTVAVETPPRRKQGKPMNLNPPVTVTPDHKKKTEGKLRKISKEQESDPNTVHRSNGVPSNEDSNVENGSKSKEKPAAVTHEDLGETPKRSKRRLDSITNQPEEPSKKQKTETAVRRPSDVDFKTPVRGNKTPKTPKTDSKSATGDDVNTKMNIEKIKELQKREISLIEREGTKECSLWRLVTEYHDPATVPEDWTCQMNPDPEGRICGIGGEKVEEEETVDVEYTCGSMVWAKLKGFPPWPGMVDYCPDTQEFYWVEEEVSETVPTWYHVVFFEGEGSSVSRSWVKTEGLQKMAEPLEEPKGWAKIAGTKRQKMRKTLEMAKEAITSPRQQRLERFSFASLYKGKWGKYADLTGEEEEAAEKEEEALSETKKKKIQLVKTPKSAEPTKPTPKESQLNQGKRKNSVDSTKGSKVRQGAKETERKSEEVTEAPKESGETSVPPRKGKALLNRKAAIMGLDSPRRSELPVKPRSITTQIKEDIRTFMKESEKKRKRSGETLMNKVEAKMSMGDNMTPQKSESVNGFGEIKTEPRTDPNASMPNILSPLAATTSPSSKSFVPEKRASSTVRLTSRDGKGLKKNYSKPPLPSDVMIALAVRNLDPENHYGAKFASIQAFLSLIFPYFNEQKLECREMIRRAYDVNAKEETGKENFRIKGSLVEQLSVRIKSYVERSRTLVKEAMLVPELLEILLEKFEYGRARGAEGKLQPPWSTRMLAYLALLTLKPPATSEQVVIFLSLIFPAMDDRNDSRRQDFERVLRTDENIVDGNRRAIFDTVHKFFSSNANRKMLRDAIYDLKLVKLVLPDEN